MNLYVEKESSTIFEVKFFGDFVMLRPAGRGHEDNISRMDINTFSRYFNEYLGDPEPVIAYLEGPDDDGSEEDAEGCGEADGNCFPPV
jgi:hypothetical protein